MAETLQITADDYQKGFGSLNEILLLKCLSDSYGHIDPEMTPFWHLSIVASSFIMLKESTENTLYNVAQVANITQLVSC